MRSKAERTGLLRKAFQVCTLVNAQVSNAGTQFRKECPPAQPVGGFRVCMAVRDGGPLVMGELAAPPVNSSLTLFLFHRARRIFFLVSQKENGGCISTGKACFLPGTPVFCESKENGDSIQCRIEAHSFHKFNEIT